MKQRDLFGDLDDEPERPGTGRFVPPDDDRPPYAVADDWDRMVRMVRARDRLRPRGVTGADAVVEEGPRPRLVSVTRPEIWTYL